MGGASRWDEGGQHFSNYGTICKFNCTFKVNPLKPSCSCLLCHVGRICFEVGGFVCIGFTTLGMVCIGGRGTFGVQYVVVLF